MKAASAFSATCMILPVISSRCTAAKAPLRSPPRTALPGHQVQGQTHHQYLACSIRHHKDPRCPSAASIIPATTTGTLLLPPPPRPAPTVAVMDLLQKKTCCKITMYQTGHALHADDRSGALKHLGQSRSIWDGDHSCYLNHRKTHDNELARIKSRPHIGNLIEQSTFRISCGHCNCVARQIHRVRLRSADGVRELSNKLLNQT